MKIHVLFTGGTIGSQLGDGVLNVADGTQSQLLTLFHEERPHAEIIFETETLFHTLSENMTLSHLQLLYSRILSLEKQKPDGIIITHGTDTLAYSANFLALMCQDVKIPILLVSANSPLVDTHSDGVRNFLASVDFISQVKLRGVYVPFLGNHDFPVIHLGTRLLPVASFEHECRSLGNVPFGHMISSGFVRNEQLYNPLPTVIDRKVCIKIPVFPTERTILYLESYPGFSYSMLDFTKKPDAILLGLYHSGTACALSQKEQFDVISFIKRCAFLGIPCYGAPIDSKKQLYASSNRMLDAGLRFLYDISTVAAYCKLVIAYGSFTDQAQRERFLEADIACEHFTLPNMGR